MKLLRVRRKLKLKQPSIHSNLIMRNVKSNPSPGNNIRIRISAHSNSKDKKSEITRKTPSPTKVKQPTMNPQNYNTSNTKSYHLTTNKLSQFKSNNAQKSTPTKKNILKIQKKTSQPHPQKPSNIIMSLLFSQNRSKQNRLQSPILDKNRSKSRKSSFAENQSLFDLPLTNLSSLRGTFFEITSTVSLQIDLSNFNRKVDCGIQTAEITLDDKYYLAYKKYRTLKEKSYEEIKSRQAKISSMINQNKEFQKKHAELLNYINEGPSNERQHRVFGIHIDLQKQQQKLSKKLDKIQKWRKKIYEDEVFMKVKDSLRKSESIMAAISNLINVCLNGNKNQYKNKSGQGQSSGQGPSNIAKYILEWINSQLQSFDCYSVVQALSAAQSWYEQTASLKHQYQEFTSLQYQNRVLLYNFIKQISKVPILTNQLFGCHNEQINTQLTKEEQLFDQFMTINCERCYQTKRKVHLIKTLNAQNWPYFKVAEWLVRDCNKQKPLLAFI